MKELKKFQSEPIKKELVEFFSQNGFVYISGFYDLSQEILPIQQDIYDLIGLIASDNGVQLERPLFTPPEFDAGLSSLIAANRHYGGVLYDAVKKIPSYVRLACARRHEEYVKALLNTERVGFANRGFGIRMDNPNEDQYATQLHQDYISQLCSQRGVVFWSPLRNTIMEIGPVRLYPGSHKEGVFTVAKVSRGSQGLVVQNAEIVKARYDSIAPEVLVGDCIIMDYLLLHESGRNRSARTRWSMISRYFDFNHQSGRLIGWKGGLQDGNTFESVHPELTMPSALKPN